VKTANTTRHPANACYDCEIRLFRRRESLPLARNPFAMAKATDAKEKCSTSAGLAAR